MIVDTVSTPALVASAVVVLAGGGVPLLVAIILNRRGKHRIEHVYSQADK